MSEDENSPKDKKKDLTGIFELQKTEALPEAEADPFAVNVLPPVEQVDSFESIDALGMLEPEAPLETPPETAPEPISEAIPEPPVVDTPTEILPLDAAPPMDFLDQMKNYAERVQETTFDPGTRYSFHLLLKGEFDPYSRDKLLLFITENPIGLNSSELDLQIKAGRVLLPRISEFAGIKLIQELRDSGLTFSLAPSPLDSDEIIPDAPSISYHYSSDTTIDTTKSDSIPILPKESVDPKIYQVIDTIKLVQFLKAEILEVEKSELFQELLDRMTGAMKKKGAHQGAQALTSLEHKITPLRLPSQYQIELSAHLLKKL